MRGLIRRSEFKIFKGLYKYYLLCSPFYFFDLIFAEGIFTGLIEIFIIAVSLSMDAFAVSVSNGMCFGKKSGILPAGLICGIVFGLFQGAMPVIGYTLGASFGERIERIDHYVALVLLGAIGIKMLIGEKKQDNEELSLSEDKLSFGMIMVQGFATSVDALAVGVSFAALSGNIVSSAAVICSVTMLISAAGFAAGCKFGRIPDRAAEIAGGLALIAIGLKIFISHVI